jgi:hypothetical protein
MRQEEEVKTLGRQRQLSFLSMGLLLTCLLAGPAAAGKKGQGEKQNRPEPKLSLTVTPAFGFAPLEVQLVATLNGVDPNDLNFCHAAVTWTRVDPGSSPEKQTRITEAPRCVHAADQISVNTTFSKSFELASPGSYLYRASVSGKDGKEIFSTYVTVKVLRVP